LNLHNHNKKMILCLGDSNFRNTCEVNKERLEASIGEEFTFKMATSNESVKAHLEAMTEGPSIIIIGTPINEVVKITSNNKNKGRDETMRAIIEELSKIVHQSAVSWPGTLHILFPPFLRLEPAWMGTKIRLGVFYVKDHVTVNSPPNILVSNSVDVNKDDLDDDKIHLNQSGKEKLFKVIESDLLRCKERPVDGQGQDWAADMYEPPTPTTFRKRPRPAEGLESGDEEAGGKKAKLDSVLDKIESLVREIKQERTETKMEINSLAEKVEENKTGLDEVKETLKTLKERRDGAFLDAITREDIDGLENENLKNTIIVRKLKTPATIPREKKAWRAFVQTEARKLVAKILDQAAAKEVRYAAPLFAFIDPSKKDNRPGLIPPFKIGFSTKDGAVRFREAALKKSKEEGSEFKETYFSYFQSTGTRIRTMLMWSVCDAIKSNTTDCWVNQTSKPTLQIKEGGRIVKTLSFVNTMVEYKDKISRKTIDEATKLAKKGFAGNLEKIFIVIKD
jgi:hypothetical protein